MRKILITIWLAALASTTAAAQTWEDVFTDSALRSLIDEALQNNSDVRTARLAVEQSEAMLRSARLSYLPYFAFSPSVSATKQQHQTGTWNYELPLKMEWELSLGGRQHHQKQAARAQVLQSEAQLRYARVSLIAQLSNAYYTLVMLDRQLSISRQSYRNQQENVALLRALKDVGQQNETAVSQAEAACLGVAASLPMLEAQISQTETAICLLLGREPSAVSRTAWQDVAGVALDSLTDIPMERLAMRPDVQAAEQLLRMSFSNVKAARSAFYPTLTINGSAGWTDAVNPASMLLNAVGSLVQPLMSRGALKAQLKVAKSQGEQAQIAFAQALLTASGEVRDALASRDACRRREELRASQVASCQRAYDSSVAFMNNAGHSYLEVLTAQSALLDAQLQQAAEWLEKQQSMINLYKATCTFLP